jgi:hypothetical protein
VAQYSVTILADPLSQVTALRGRGLDLHERAARRRADTGDLAVPAVLSDEQIVQLRAEGYRVDVQEDADRDGGRARRGGCPGRRPLRARPGRPCREPGPRGRPAGLRGTAGAPPAPAGGPLRRR